MAKVKMIKRLFKGKGTIVCPECGETVQDATNDILIFVPYCGHCGKRIEDAVQDYCGHCGKILDWA